MSAARLKGAWPWWGMCCVALVIGISLVITVGSDSLAGDKSKPDMRKAYKLYQAKCLGCHDSVADPEKPGRTRDGWFVVVNLMHKRGVNVTPDEGSMIVDLLFSLRRGIEKDPG